MLALVLTLSLATSLDDYNSARLNGNAIGLGVLGAWGAASAVTGALGLVTVSDAQWQGAHLANLAWGVVNIGFAVVGLFVKTGATHTARADALADGQSTQFTYSWNAALDVTYLAAAALLLLNVKDARVAGFARGSLVQAAWLLAFDSVMALFHQVNNERVR